MGFNGLKDLLAQVVLLQQVAEGQDRGLIGDSIADQLDAGKATHGGHLDPGQGLLEVCPSKPGSLAAATVSCAGIALHPCRHSLPNLPPLAT